MCESYLLSGTETAFGILGGDRSDELHASFVESTEEPVRFSDGDGETFGVFEVTGKFESAVVSAASHVVAVFV